MRNIHLLTQVFSRPWLITPDAHRSIAKLVESHAANHQAIDFGDLINQRDAARIDENGTATISILGVIGKGLSKVEKSCGATDINDISREIDSAIGAGAQRINFYVNSPGGTVTGVPELAAKIRSLDVPTLAYTDDMACSAAYWIASAADEFAATPSATVGSIGVYLPWVDYSKAYEAAGVRPDPVVNSEGTYKAIGFWPALTEEHRKHLQAGVDATFEEFKGFVTAERDINPEALHGQTFNGNTAKEMGLIDFVCPAELGCSVHEYASALTLGAEVMSIFKSKKEELAEQIEILEAQLSGEQATIEHLEDENEQLTSQLADLEAKHELLTQEHAKLHAILSSLGIENAETAEERLNERINLEAAELAAQAGIQPVEKTEADAETPLTKGDLWAQYNKLPLDQRNAFYAANRDKMRS